MNKIDLTKIMQDRTGDSLNPLPQDIYMPTLAAAFLLDCKARNLTKQTQHFYRVKLEAFVNWLDAQAVKRIDQITPDLLRGVFCCHDRSGT